MGKGKGEIVKKIVTMAHELLKDYIKEDSICADFTMGNGYDTFFLAQLAKKGRVYAFDIQETALLHTKALLQDASHVRLILDDHAHMDAYITTPLDAAIFNFGYLPNGDPSITTNKTSSKQAVTKAYALLKRHGLLVLVLYPGHPQGKEEADCFLEWCEQLDVHHASVMKIAMVHKPQAPFILAIEKVGE